MKLDAVVKRGSKKDFLDVYYLFEKFTPHQILEWYSQMFHDATSFHIVRSLTCFEDAEATEMPFVFDKKLTWEKAKRRMVEVVRSNF